ncbi:2303cfb5-d1fa-4227-90b3-8b377ecb0daf [Sclerotinia trifoliorum]|uniref:2303cfb5-d1fa-4227-90b3-8b377ecb0daf n=1 Tax=Sclerotinia trifoliorum TaxID=28548 RepID=A0A8H2ZST2_9HELO|nr:2303cfb5-d1fa-4227-90b3-8b377ecb0daf [Sclerotinia trifoliorum]
MENHQRILRSSSSASKVSTPLPPNSMSNLDQPVTFISAKKSPSLNVDEKIRLVPSSSKLRGLDRGEVTLLRKKQSRLMATALSTFKYLPSGTHILNSMKSTLIFAQYEAGTAVCIDPIGWILTCSHCIGETEEECRKNPRRWLLYYTGLAIEVECRVWDPKRDLALLKVISIEVDDENSENTIPQFSYVNLATQLPETNTSIICIGQPGSDDLESSNDRKTKYKLIEVSEGLFHGMMSGKDPQDNEEIGTLKHDAWTYWGHSGAPLLRNDNGLLIGLHSSWDDQTAMRHGIPVVAIRTFLEMHLRGAECLKGVGPV